MGKKYWKVKEEKGQGYWYEDNIGNVSEKFEFADSYYEGFAVVKLSNGKFAYRDVNGLLSKEYACAYPYSYGFGLVKLDNGKFAYRDASGDISEEYKDAGVYINGIARVKLVNGKCAIRDTNGKLTNGYKYVSPCSNGFNQVGTDDEKFVYRDPNGIILENCEDVGKVLNNKVVSVYDLKEDVFESDSLVDVMLKKLRTNAKKSIELATTKKELDDVEDNYTKDTEYVLSKAYDAKQKQELLASKQSLLDKLNLR